MAAGSFADEGLEIANLVREIQAGGAPEESFRRLFERYCSPVTAFFINRGFSRETAEELAQETFLRVYTQIGTFRREATFDTWLFKIAANVWKNALRTRSTQKRQAETVPLEAVVDDGEEKRPRNEPHEQSQDPLDQVLAGEREQLLLGAIEKLPPKMRECALLRLGQGLKYRQIAALTGISIATVKSQLNAARQRLKPLLEEHSDVFGLDGRGVPG